MRLFEIVSVPTKIAITPKFASNFTKGTKKYPDLPSRLLAFSKAKLTGQKYGKRDKPFTGAPLAGYNHAHLNLSNGLMIVIYSRSGDTILLYEVLPHKEYEGNSIPNLMRWLNSVPSDDFVEVDPNIIFGPREFEKEITISDKDREDIVTAIYDLIAEDAYDILNNAINKNNWDALLEWLDMVVPDIDKDLLFAAFGGQYEVKQLIMKGLKNYGKLDDFNKFISR